MSLVTYCRVCERSDAVDDWPVPAATADDAVDDEVLEADIDQKPTAR